MLTTMRAAGRSGDTTYPSDGSEREDLRACPHFCPPFVPPFVPTGLPALNCGNVALSPLSLDLENSPSYSASLCPIAYTQLHNGNVT